VIWRRFDGASDVVQGSPPAHIPVPAAALAPGSWSFGAVPVAAQSSARVFELTDSGDAPLSVFSISIEGADAGQFSTADAPACVGAIQPGASCEFSVFYRPSRTGVHTATVEIATNAASSPDLAILSGTGLAAGLPGAPPAQQAKSAIRVGNAFSIGRPRRNRRRGTARLPVTLPGPGTVIAAGQRVTKRRVDEAGTVTVAVRARGRKLKALNRRGRVTVGLAITFVPHGGEPITRRTSIRLVKRRTARRSGHRRCQPPRRSC
jgi:hypothetical protein